MLHTTHKLIVKFLSEHDMRGKRVLDVGSLNVNGAIDVEFKESGMEYTGLDMREGPNVDVVLNGHDIKEHFAEGSFDLVVCFDTLEHDDRFWLTVDNLRWVLKPGGWLILGTPSINHPIHAHPSDYYRFLDSAYKDVFFEGYENVWIEMQTYGDQGPGRPDQVYGYGQKP